MRVSAAIASRLPGLLLALGALAIGLGNPPAHGQACDDGNPCTDDVVNQTTGQCAFLPDDSNACNDGDDVCTTSDVCRGGQCVCQVEAACGTGPARRFVNPTATPMPFNAIVSSTIAVSGAEPSLWKARVTTSIRHSDPGNLDVTLRSPSGTVVTLTTGNGASVNGDVFRGTLWDDDANPGGNVPYVNNAGVVTDHPYVSGSVATPLTPEEPLGAFAGENPNGTWTLTLRNRSGSALSPQVDWWILELTGQAYQASGAEQTFSNSTAQTVPRLTTRSSTIAVAGQGPRIGKVTVVPVIGVSTPQTIDVALTSPAGTVVTLSSKSLCPLQSVTMDDDVDPGGAIPSNGQNLVHDCSPVNGPVPSTRVPEEPLAAFRGENPNGTWTLRVANSGQGETAQFYGWFLGITTVTCFATCGDCDDGNPCTDDACDQLLGCAHTSDDTNQCSDGDACTSDACVSGTCTHAPVICGTNACEQNVCDPLLGCRPVVCDDGLACTVDSCDPQAGCGSTPTDCGDPCSECNPANGHCVAIDCDDGVACTFDSCDPVKGCVHTPVDANCGPAGPCFSSHCDAELGCVNTPTDEGGGCRLPGCFEGVCHAGSCTNTFNACDDGNPCNWDVCEDYYSCVHYPCRWYGGCAYGNCTPGVGCGPANCDDSDPCTADSCQDTTIPPGYQCSHYWMGGAACDDGNPCTVNDRCGPMNCAGTSAAPAEVGPSVRLTRDGGDAVVSWDPSLAPGELFDVLRGELEAVPVGSAPAFETCLLDDTAAGSASDSEPAHSGSGFWYLVRKDSACGRGTYGWSATNGTPGAERLTATCP